MTSRDIKRELREYWYITQHLCNMAERYNRMRAQAEKVTPTYSLAPGGLGSQERMADQVNTLVDMERKYQAEFAAARAAMHRVEQLIASLDDYTQRVILEDRYLEFMKWEAIAMKHSYTYRRVIQLHGEALRILSEQK